MKKLFRWAASLAALVMAIGSVSCSSPRQTDDPAKDPGTAAPTASPSDPSKESGTLPDGSTDPGAVPQESSVMKLAFLDPEGHCIYVYGEKGDPGYADSDFTSLYAEYGRDVTLEDVHEDPDTGLAYLVVKGKRIFLGLDFLSRAMIYNSTPAGAYPSEEDAYAAWWRFYLTRWNTLLPEIPLCEEEAATLCRSEISGPEKVPETAWRGLSRAVLYWTTTKENNTVTIASVEKLTGKYRYPSFNAQTVSAPDRSVSELTDGLELVSLTEDGRFVWNETVVHDHEEVKNEDGSMTYTVTLWEDLRFSVGTYVTAKDYLAFPMAFLSAPGAEADPGFLQRTGLSLLGADLFASYQGGGEDETEDTARKVFSGLRILDERKFSLTVPGSSLPDVNRLSAIRLTAQYAPMWLGESEILDDGEGCYLSEDFYEKDTLGKYLSAERIRRTAEEPSSSDAYPFSGPYSVIWYSEGGQEGKPMVVLSENPYFSGDLNGQKPGIRTLVWKTAAQEEIYAELANGTTDVFTCLNDPEDILSAREKASASGDTLRLSVYQTGRASALHFRADLGPVQFGEVRKALAHLLDRDTLRKGMSAGNGALIDAPCTGNALYHKAVKNGLRLKSYKFSLAEAILLLEAGGWIYNSRGEAYTSGIRYKKIAKELLDERNRAYTSADGSAKAFEKDGYIYMPLSVNVFAVRGSLLSENLQAILKNEVFKDAGMLISVTEGSYPEAMDELYQKPVSGYYQGLPLQCAFDADSRNYASAPMNDSVLFAVNPKEYEVFSQSFFRDPADVVWLK